MLECSPSLLLIERDPFSLLQKETLASFGRNNNTALQYGSPNGRRIPNRVQHTTPLMQSPDGTKLQHLTKINNPSRKQNRKTQRSIKMQVGKSCDLP
jgi:hypothetical protein